MPAAVRPVIVTPPVAPRVTPPVTPPVTPSGAPHAMGAAALRRALR